MPRSLNLGPGYRYRSVDVTYRLGAQLPLPHFDSLPSRGTATTSLTQQVADPNKLIHQHYRESFLVKRTHHPRQQLPSDTLRVYLVDLVYSAAMVLTTIPRALAVAFLSLTCVASAYQNSSSAQLLRSQQDLFSGRPKDCPPWYVWSTKPGVHPTASGYTY